jgi:hypothetical protein
MDLSKIARTIADVRLAGRIKYPTRELTKQLKNVIRERNDIEKRRKMCEAEMMKAFKTIKSTFEETFAQRPDKAAEFDAARDEAVRRIIPEFEDTTAALKRQHELEQEIRILEQKLRMDGTREKEILTSIDQLGRNVSTGGQNNLGVYEIEGYPEYVARRTRWTDLDPANDMVTYSGALKTHPNIKKTVQVKEFTMEDGSKQVYQVMEKATGKPLNAYSQEYLQGVPEEHKEQFWDDVNALRRLGIKIDTEKDDNYFYDPAVGFQFIDLHPGNITSDKTIRRRFPFLNAPA